MAIEAAQPSKAVPRKTATAHAQTEPEGGAFAAMEAANEPNGRWGRHQGAGTTEGVACVTERTAQQSEGRRRLGLPGFRRPSRSPWRSARALGRVARRREDAYARAKQVKGKGGGREGAAHLKWSLQGRAQSIPGKQPFPGSGCCVP